MVIDSNLIEKGDRIEVWIDQPRVAVVKEIIEDSQGRTFRVHHQRVMHDIHVPVGHSVNLVC